MLWQSLAVASMGVSTVATGLTTLRLCRAWDVRVSSVRWLFSAFFLYLWLWGCARCVYFIYVALNPLEMAYSASADEREAFERYSSLSIYTILQWKVTSNAVVTAMLCLGDAMLFTVAVLMVPLVYELAKIATKSMDRGADKERRQIRRYAVGVHALQLVFVAVEASLAVAYDGYSEHTQRCLLAVYFIEFGSFLYMIWLIVRLKVIGRKYENVQGQFITSPVYQRLKRFMMVYGVFSFQYQLATVIMYVFPDSEERLLDVISVSLVLYYLAGLALAVTTMCSQTCVLQTCRWCLPNDIEAQLQTRLMLEQDLLSPRENRGLDTEPPLVNPVFVFTDIESSSALWGIGDGHVMQRATELHDNILRSSLMKYRGYEITTAGDAFQLAFHTIREAVEYCLDVQLQLLVANWPKELHNALPATKKHRSGHRLIFNGLRVRMGIHDAVESDGPLVLDVHAVTGKMIYTGAAEVIANEIGDLGDGGQILVTKRVAEWLQLYEDLVSIESIVARVGEYAIPTINTKLEVFQVLPEVLSGRKKLFTCNLRKRSATSVSSGPTRYSQRSEYRERLRRLRQAAQRADGELQPRRSAAQRFFIRVDHGSFYANM